MNELWKDRPLVIVHTESHRQWGGQEKRVFNEGCWMRKIGHRLILLAPAGSPVFKRAEENGWETRDVSFNRLSTISDIIKVRTILKQIKPDVFNTHGNQDGKVGLIAASGLEIPCIILSRHISAPVSNNWYNRILYRKKCHYIFTTSRAAADQIMQVLNIAQGKIYFVPSGIQVPEDLPDMEQARMTFVKEFHLDSEARFIGCVSRLDEQKGIANLIQAFHLIHQNIPDHHLVILGEGEGRSGFELLARSCHLSQKVHFPGFREDIWPFYRAIDCKVLASNENEGVPQALLEAMFAGCPVVATRVGGIPDVVQHEETGLLVPPDNPKRIGEAILETLKGGNTARRIENALNRVEKSHTIHAMGKKILDIYRLKF